MTYDDNTESESDSDKEATISKIKKAKITHFVSLIEPPKQRQKWGETQVLPHIDWGDLFFDLFYVGGAYNLSNILKYDPTVEGLLYFIGCFMSIFNNFWTEKTYYDARFNEGEDAVHLLWEVIQTTLLATAVLNIRPVEYMSHVKDYQHMFAFCLANCLGIFMNGLRLIEIGFVWVDGQEAAIHGTRRQLLGNTLPKFIVSLVATVFTGVWYYGSDVNYEISNDRLLASSPVSDGTGFVSHLPIILCATTTIIRPLTLYASAVLWSGEDYKSRSVPVNVDFVIHRFGEFNMLMLGECVLSLLIVDTSTTHEYYISFYAGILSVILLTLLHYKSQPKHANNHVLRQSRTRGIVWITLVGFYSAALIAVGVSYKMLMTEQFKLSNEVGYETGARNLSFYDGLDYQKLQENYHVHHFERLLASSGGGYIGTLSTKERQQRISNIFCIGLATIFFCHDMMILCHREAKSWIDTFQHIMTNSRGKVSKGSICLFFGHFISFVFIATLWLYIHDPMHIVLLGLALIALQILFRSHFFVRAQKNDPFEGEYNKDGHRIQF